MMHRELNLWSLYIFQVLGDQVIVAYHLKVTSDTSNLSQDQ